MTSTADRSDLLAIQLRQLEAAHVATILSTSTRSLDEYVLPGGTRIFVETYRTRGVISGFEVYAPAGDRTVAGTTTAVKAIDKSIPDVPVGAHLVTPDGKVLGTCAADGTIDPVARCECGEAYRSNRESWVCPDCDRTTCLHCERALVRDPSGDLACRECDGFAWVSGPTPDDHARAAAIDVVVDEAVQAWLQPAARRSPDGDDLESHGTLRARMRVLAKLVLQLQRIGADVEDL